MNLHISRRLMLSGTGVGLGAAFLAACGSDSESATTADNGSEAVPTLTMSAIPDQDPELLNRLYGSVAERFAAVTGGTAEYTPLTDYPAVVRAFEVGDIYIAWMGGLTGVQARSRVEGAQAIAQRDIDADFTSIFIANKSAGLAPVDDVAGLSEIAGKTFTFGSDTSTSGRLMPQYFMDQAGVSLDDLRGKPGFSGSHDATIEAVAAGSFEVGAVNSQVWRATVEAGELDVSDVVVLLETPGYADYHWLVRPDLDEVFGAGTQDKVAQMLFDLDIENPDDAEILELFGAESFIPTENSNYDQIEAVASEVGLLA